MADCTAEARSPLSAARVSRAISKVATTMPSAIHGARAPAVSSGLSDAELSTPPKPLVTTATASITTETSIAVVSRSIGPLLNPRSVRYQCPSSSPAVIDPRKAAPASNWNSATANPWRAVPAIATRVAIEATRLRKPATRAAWRCLASISRNVRPTAAAVASARVADQRPASSPAICAARVDSHAPSASTSRIEVVSVKNPRLTSCHSGVHHTNASVPATASASTSAM